MYDEQLSALSWASLLALALSRDFDLAALIQDLILVTDDLVGLPVLPFHLGFFDETVEPDDFAWGARSIEGVEHAGIDGGGAGGSGRAWEEVGEGAREGGSRGNFI